MRYTFIYTPDHEDGGYVAQCAEVPAAIEQGETIAEARRNLKSALKFVLEAQAELALKGAPSDAKMEYVEIKT